MKPLDLDGGHAYEYAVVHADDEPWIEGWSVYRDRIQSPSENRIQIHSQACSDIVPQRIHVDANGVLADDGTIDWPTGGSPRLISHEVATVESITPEELVLVDADSPITSDVEGATEELADLCLDAGYNVDASRSGGDA